MNLKKQLANQNFTIENYMAATGLSHEEIINEIKKGCNYATSEFFSY